MCQTCNLTAVISALFNEHSGDSANPGVHYLLEFDCGGALRAYDNPGGVGDLRFRMVSHDLKSKASMTLGNGREFDEIRH